jgi:hypothetical protein
MKSISCLLLFCLAFASCKKEKAKEPTRQELLTSSTWKYDNGGIDQNRDGSIDITLEATGYVQQCALDNTGTFHTDGTGIADEGPTKCNDTLPQTVQYNWAFRSNETAIDISGSGLFGLGGSFTINELTSTNLTLHKDSTFTFPGFPPTTVGLIVHLKH